ncbi:hypothetical protein H4R20_003870, partial [Coemansia guatemalensis]
ALNAVLVAAKDAPAEAAALALAGGVAMALAHEAPETFVASRACAVATRLIRSLCVRQADVVALCMEIVPSLDRRSTDELASDDIVLLSLSEAVLNPHARYLDHSSGASQAALLLQTLVSAPTAKFASVHKMIALVHANATAVLLANEHSRSIGGGQRCLALLHVVEAILLRYFVEDIRVRVAEKDLVDAWCDIVDSMAAVHSATLEHGRGGSEVFRRAISISVQFILRCTPDHVDAAVRRLFHQQQCLRFLASSSCSLQMTSSARNCVVLFYLDLMEHMVGQLQSNTLSTLVLPLAARYATAEALRAVGPQWFESAHALLLACLELATDPDWTAKGGRGKRSMECVVVLVPWYSDLLLDLYPDDGISADLLRIAFTTAVQAAAVAAADDSAPWGPGSDVFGAAVDGPGKKRKAAAVLAWDCVSKLMHKLDMFPALATENSEAKQSADAGRVGTAVRSVRRRELLCVLALQLSAVPLQMLPRLMTELRGRVLAEPEWATRKALADEVQQIVMDRADLARKPALASWAWQLRIDVNSSIGASKI